jgi:hypothetical protein
LTVLRLLKPSFHRTEDKKFESGIRLRRRFAEASDLLQQTYSALGSVDQRKVERAVTAVRIDTSGKFNAADVCNAIADALGDDIEVNSAIHDLITDYAFALAQLFSQHGIKPGRAMHPADPNYRSKFHRFADLVLTWAVEPWSKRHDSNRQEISAALRRAHAQLPSDIRGSVRYAPRRSDVEWLVSDDHLRAALARFKK